MRSLQPLVLHATVALQATSERLQRKAPTKAGPFSHALGGPAISSSGEMRIRHKQGQIAAGRLYQRQSELCRASGRVEALVEVVTCATNATARGTGQKIAPMSRALRLAVAGKAEEPLGAVAALVLGDEVLEKQLRGLKTFRTSLPKIMPATAAVALIRMND